MNQPSLADKVSVLVNGLRMNRDIDLARILCAATQSEVVHLHIPETLLATPKGRCILYTDGAGIVRHHSDPK